MLLKSFNLHHYRTKQLFADCFGVGTTMFDSRFFLNCPLSSIVIFLMPDLSDNVFD